MELFWHEVAYECLNKGSGDLSELEKAKDDDDFNSILDRITGETFDEYFNPRLLELEPESELAEYLPSITAWIERATASYLEQVRRFRDMRFASKSVYAKHFPVGLSTNDIRRQTKIGKQVSRFFKGVTPERLEGLMWVILDDFWRPLLRLKRASIYVDAITVIGASKGRDTSWIHFDIDLSTPQSHAYPILESEIPTDAPRTSADNLQGCVTL